MAKEYIEREALYEKAYWHGERPDFGNPCAEGVDAVDIADVDAIPAADVVEVVHGRWIPLEYDGYADGNPVWDLWECSECQEEHSGDEDTLTPYCPNCGAKMDGEPNADG